MKFRTFLITGVLALAPSMVMAEDMENLVLQKALEYEMVASFFAMHGSPAPNAMAHAAMTTKRLFLSVGQAVVESLGNPGAVGRAGEKGAWQVIESHWGRVPEDPLGQARQAEQILEELLSQSDGNLEMALRRYNGRPGNPKTARYARLVLSKSFQAACGARIL